MFWTERVGSAEKIGPRTIGAAAARAVQFGNDSCATGSASVSARSPNLPVFGAGFQSAHMGPDTMISMDTYARN